MTNEQKAAVQKAALAAARSVPQRDIPIATAIERSSVAKWFEAGAQTILENPGEWGLVSMLDSMEHIEESDHNWNEVVNSFKAEMEKYREALEDVDWELADEGFANSTGEGVGRARDIIKEVLKHNEQ